MARAPKEATTGACLKGTVVREFVRYLERKGGLEDVRARVPPSTRELIDHPPLPSEWVSGAHSIAIVEAVGHVEGVKAVHEMTWEAVTPLFRLIRAVLEGVIRLFGPTPHAVFSKISLVMATSWRGYEYTYRDLGPSSGRMEIRSLGVRETPMSAESWAAAATRVLHTCGTTGRADVRSLIVDERDSVVVVDIAWGP